MCNILAKAMLTLVNALKCRQCNKDLTSVNSYVSRIAKYDYICKHCESMRASNYRTNYYNIRKDLFKQKNKAYRLKEAVDV